MKCEIVAVYVETADMLLGKCSVCRYGFGSVFIVRV